MSSHFQNIRSVGRVAGVIVLAAVALAPVIYRFVARPGDTPVEPGQIVLKYMAWGNPQQLNVEREVISRFNAKCRAEGKNVRVELFMAPAMGYSQKLQLMLAGDSAPDVMRVDHYLFPSLAPKGCFYDLTDMAKADPSFDIRDFHEQPMSEGYYKGRLYGMNMLFGPIICYYNKDLFQRAGLTDPYDLWKQGRWTWDEFRKAAVALTRQDASGATEVYGFYTPASLLAFWAPFIWGHGGQILSADHTRCLLDSPEAVAGLQLFRDLRFKYRVMPSPSDVTSGAFTFESGRMAMEFNFPGNAPRYRDNIRNFRWDVAPTPYESGHPVALIKGNQVVIWRGCKHPKEAWEWIKFLTSRQTELFLYGDQLRRAVATHKSLLVKDPVTGKGGEFLIANQPFFHTDIFPFALDHARELPIDFTWPIWTTSLQKYLDILILREGPEYDACNVMPTAVREVDQVLERERGRMKRYVGVDAGGANGE